MSCSLQQQQLEAFHLAAVRCRLVLSVWSFVVAQHVAGSSHKWQQLGLQMV